MVESSWLFSKRIKAFKDAERTGIKSGREVRPTHWSKAKNPAHSQLSNTSWSTMQATKQAGIQVEETQIRCQWWSKAWKTKQMRTVQLWDYERNYYGKGVKEEFTASQCEKVGHTSNWSDNTNFSIKKQHDCVAASEGWPDNNTNGKYAQGRDGFKEELEDLKDDFQLNWDSKMSSPVNMVPLMLSSLQDISCTSGSGRMFQGCTLASFYIPEQPNQCYGTHSAGKDSSWIWPALYSKGQQGSKHR